MIGAAVGPGGPGGGPGHGARGQGAEPGPDRQAITTIYYAIII